MKIPGILSILALAFLSGCASSYTYPAGQALLGRSVAPSQWTAASVRAKYDLHWIHGRSDFRFLVNLRTLGSVGRMDLAMPSGTQLASISWQGDRWQVLYPGQATLVEGQGGIVPLPMIGIVAFPYQELDRLARGLLVPPEVSGKAMSQLYVGKGVRVLLTEADAQSRRWALHVNEETGLLQRVQRFQGPVQEADLQNLAFLKDLPVPSRMRREFDTASSLDLELLEWSDRSFVAPTELAFTKDTALDTVAVENDRLGRRYYTIRSSHQDSLPPFPGDFLASPRDTSVVDSLDGDDADSSEDGDLPDIAEEELVPEDADLQPAHPVAPPALAAPALKAILKDVPAEMPSPSEPNADDVPVAQPPSEALQRRF